MDATKKLTDTFKLFLQAGEGDSRYIPLRRFVPNDMYLFVPKNHCQVASYGVDRKVAFINLLLRLSPSQLFTTGNLMVAGEVNENENKFCYRAIRSEKVRNNAQVFMIWPTECFSSGKRLWLAKKVGQWGQWSKKDVYPKAVAQELENLPDEDFPEGCTPLGKKTVLTGQDFTFLPPSSPSHKSSKRKKKNKTNDEYELSLIAGKKPLNSPEPMERMAGPNSQSLSATSTFQFVPPTSSTSSTSAALAAPSMFTAVPNTSDPKKRMMEKIIDAFVFDVIETERDGMNTKPSDEESPLIPFHCIWQLKNAKSPKYENGLNGKIFSELVKEWSWMIGVKKESRFVHLDDYEGSRTFNTRIVVCCPRFTKSNPGYELQWFYRDVGSYLYVDKFVFPNQTVEALVQSLKRGTCIPSSAEKKLLESPEPMEGMASPNSTSLSATSTSPFVLPTPIFAAPAEQIETNPNPVGASAVTNADAFASENAAVNPTSNWRFIMPQSFFNTSVLPSVPPTSSTSFTPAALAAPSMFTAVPNTSDPEKEMMEKIIDAFVFDVIETERDGMNTKPSDEESPLIPFQYVWKLKNVKSPKLENGLSGKIFSELVKEWS
eukprot:GHVT01033671.1.p1 GENE.GHVT01033671.1~~GHVT01033671.1.p1  ORF type:complete len:615 (+),score=71.98 GHVT01033671.1:39-1847(+)